MAIHKTNGFLEEYCRKIVTRETLVCEAIEMVINNLISDFNNDNYYYDTSDADKRIHFIENCTRLTKSPFYGKSMKLLLFQKAIISALYGFKMADDNTDRFQKLLLLIARKNGKSEFCSALLLSELILGNHGSDIVCASNDDQQTMILYEAVDTMRKMIDPMQCDTWRNQNCIRNKITDTRIYKLSQRTHNKEGRNIDIAVVDEVHELKDASIIKAIEQSQSTKLNPKLIIITTEGFTNDGYLDEELRYARRIIAGEIDGIKADRYLPMIFEQSDEQEIWQNRSSWIKSNPALGITKRWNFLDGMVDEARNLKSSRPYVLAKDFNLKQNNSEAWLMESDYNYECKFKLEDFKGSLCLGAVDLAATTDLASAKILIMRKGDKRKYIHGMYFIPESKLSDSNDKTAGAKYEEWARKSFLTICPGNEVDMKTVSDWFYKLYKSYGLRLYKCGYDQRFAKDFLKGMDEYGFDCEMVWQNAITLSNAAKLVEADLKDQVIYYNNNPIDRWCLGNSSIRTDNYGNILVIKTQPNKRIDGAVTLVILTEIYRRYRSEYSAYLAS